MEFLEVLCPAVCEQIGSCSLNCSLWVTDHSPTDSCELLTLLMSSELWAANSPTDNIWTVTCSLSYWQHLNCDLPTLLLTAVNWSLSYWQPWAAHSPTDSFELPTLLLTVLTFPLSYWQPWAAHSPTDRLELLTLQATALNCSLWQLLSPTDSSSLHVTSSQRRHQGPVYSTARREVSLYISPDVHTKRVSTPIQFSWLL